MGHFSSAGSLPGRTWIITAILFVSSTSMNGAITHPSALLTDRGITPSEAALSASIFGATSLLGRVIVGWLLDRFLGPRVALAINLITASGIFLLARREFPYRMPGGCVDWDWCRPRSYYHPVFTHALFWAALLFSSLWSHSGVLCRCRRDRTCNPWARIRPDRLLCSFARDTRSGPGACSYRQPPPSTIFRLVRNVKFDIVLAREFNLARSRSEAAEQQYGRETLVTLE